MRFSPSVNSWQVCLGIVGQKTQFHFLQNGHVGLIYFRLLALVIKTFVELGNENYEKKTKTGNEFILSIKCKLHGKRIYSKITQQEKICTKNTKLHGKKGEFAM